MRNINFNKPSGTTILDGIKIVAPSAKISYDPNANTLPEGDVVLAVIGEYPYAEGFGDDADLRLNKADLEVLERANASGNKVVVLLLSGRPLLVHDLEAQWDAFLASFLPGMAGEGIADVLFGDANPKGKLSFTWPTMADGSGILYAQGSGEQYN